jgi:outer membrane protein OmpA-like peptidoglycan-associated protein
MLKRVLLIICSLPCFAQKGDHHFSVFAGRTDFVIERQTAQTNYVFNQLGFGYGYGIGNRFTLLANAEIGAFAYKKIVLLPSVGSLSSTLNAASLGLQFRLFTLKKISSFLQIGTNYQTLLNTCDCVVGDRYRNEFSSFGGFQIDYRINKKWSFFLSSTINKPFSTTLNDPDFYMSNKLTDNSKDLMFKNAVGITYYIERKRAKDSDKDGVSDDKDKCPDTPKGETVNLEGCSESQLDEDSDGVVNVKDKCPKTPKGDKVNVDGCSESQLDDDLDGVFNINDKCPKTPKGEKVNVDGCSESQLDEDADGVVNVKDQCPKTPKGEKVNVNGCSESQLDNDGDGVNNRLDKCPDEKGDRLNNGCPVVNQKIEKQINEIANEINFVTNKADLLVSSMAKLNELLIILLENPDMRIIISGHTDDVGNEESNFILSEKRAQSVANYLAEKGIAKTRMTALAFGEQQLKQNDISEDARAKNRRVEIKILK